MKWPQLLISVATATRELGRSGQQQLPPKHRSLFSTSALELWWGRIPAKLDRYSQVLSTSWADGAYLTAWPRFAMVLPLLTLAFGLIEGASHWSPVTVGYSPVAFAQILHLVVIGAFVGTLSANAGLMLVIGYAVGDFFWAGPQASRYPVPLIYSFFQLRVPMLVTYLLFFMLAAMPAISTNYLLAGLRRRVSRTDIVSNVVRFGATAVVQGLFLYAWTLMIPAGIRVLWSWVGFGSQLRFMDYGGAIPWVVGAGVAGAIVRGWLTLRAQRDAKVVGQIEALEETALGGGQGQATFIQRLPWVRAVLNATLITLLVTGDSKFLARNESPQPSFSNALHLTRCLSLPEAFGREPNALPRQQLIDNEEVRNDQTFDLQTSSKAEMPPAPHSKH